MSEWSRASGHLDHPLRSKYFDFVPGTEYVDPDLLWDANSLS